jgi:thiol:disulfide interchange protein DsbA
MRLHGFLARIALPLVIVLSGSVVRADGPEFTQLAKPQPTEAPGKIEVIEFFWYGCPHCNSLEPRVEAWETRLPKDVVFRREHVIWKGRRETEVHARLFLTLRAMNLLERHHRAVFDAIHNTKLGLRDEHQVLDWVVARGIDKSKFEATYKSFGVQTQTARASARSWDYGVDGVPSFVVNGKYMTSLGGAHDPDKLFAILDKLIAGERTRK